MRTAAAKLARWSDAGLSGTSDNGSQRLADRAAAIGRPVPQRVTTTDAALQVLANQAVSDRSSGDSDRVIFVLPRGADALREVPVAHPDLTQGWWAVRA